MYFIQFEVRGVRAPPYLPPPPEGSPGGVVQATLNIVGLGSPARIAL